MQLSALHSPMQAAASSNTNGGAAFAFALLAFCLGMRTQQAGLATLVLGLWLFARSSDAASKQRLVLDDFLAVIPTTIDRFNLVRAGRQWRKGLRSYIVADRKLAFREQESSKLYRETWDVYADNENSELVLGPRQGDLRAALAPFLANHTAKEDSYKWLLYGDDDTVFFIDNVLEAVSKLDWRQPYLLSDCLWWPKGGHGVKLHPNREAPRCLPCGYDDPAIMPGDMCTGLTGFMPVQGCPCTPEQVMEGHWPGGQPKYADGRGIFDRRRGTFVDRPDDPNSPKIGWWYMIHGGAGAIISRGAMERASFGDVSAYLRSIDLQSGDAMLTKAFWNVLKLAPTDPGYGLCRPGIQMFDPSWREPRARGPEDGGTLDGGADPVGVADRLEQALSGKGCDAACEDQLLHTLTVHVRSRYAAEDLAERYPERPRSKDDEAPTYRSACHLMRKLAALHRRHATRQRGRDRFIPLWGD